MRRWTELGIVIIIAMFLSPSGRASSQRTTVRIGVFGLFHPTRLVISPATSASIVASFDGHQLRIQRDSSTPQIEVQYASSGTMEIAVGSQSFESRAFHVSADAGPVEVLLSVPEKIQRRFRGAIDVAPDGKALSPVVTMDLETAVASVVAAEYPKDTPIEALKALAVAARSYLLAGGGRHGKVFDFCDTTHCQFLRSPPEEGSPAAKAAQQTSGLVLTFNGAILPAMYSAGCGGHTYSLASLGIRSSGYPYYAVECEYCRKNPDTWARRLSKSEGDELGAVPSERARLNLVRQLGWKAIPSNSYSQESEGSDEIKLSGAGRGHGIGLCQRGAAAMARDGADFETILRHYYPNVTLERK